MKNDALISECGRYRYRLSRIWNETGPKCLFIMLNPSTADANEDDPTIRRCISFAQSWGCGSLYVGNLYAYRATDPSELKRVKDPVGPGNMQHVMAMHDMADITILAFGNCSNNSNDALYEAMKQELHNVHYLKLCKNGYPSHPLYLKGDLKPVKYGN